LAIDLPKTRDEIPGLILVAGLDLHVAVVAAIVDPAERYGLFHGTLIFVRM
jgi:hypothetical protein